MSFKLPPYNHPDFEKLGLTNAPDAAFATAEMDGVAPEGYTAPLCIPNISR